MTDQALQMPVEKILIMFFQKPFLHQATFNRRLRTTSGCYRLASYHLDFSPTVFLEYGQEELGKIIRHKLCRYHLHSADKGYQHKDKDSEELLAKADGVYYAPSLAERKRTAFHQCQCQSRGEVILRERRIDTTRYVCEKCHGRLSWQAKKEQIQRFWSLLS